MLPTSLPVFECQDFTILGCRVLLQPTFFRLRRTAPAERGTKNIAALFLWIQSRQQNFTFHAAWGGRAPSRNVYAPKMKFEAS
jgi:hypothetical protein